jgi:hypothetical protein
MHVFRRIPHPSPSRHRHSFLPYFFTKKRRKSEKKKSYAFKEKRNPENLTRIE